MKKRRTGFGHQVERWLEEQARDRAAWHRRRQADLDERDESSRLIRIGNAASRLAALEVKELEDVWRSPSRPRLHHVSCYVPPRGSIARSFFGVVR